MQDLNYLIKLFGISTRFHELYAINGKELSVAIPLIKEWLERILKIALDFSKKELGNKLARPPVFISEFLINVSVSIFYF